MDSSVSAGRAIRLRLGGLDFVGSLGSPWFRAPAGIPKEGFVHARVTLPLKGVFTILGHPLRIPPGTRWHITAPTRFPGTGGDSGSDGGVVVDLSGSRAVFGLEVPGGPMGGGWVAALNGMLRQHLETAAAGGLLRLEGFAEAGDSTRDAPCRLPVTTRPGPSLFLGKRCLLADLDLSDDCRSVHLVPEDPIALDSDSAARIEALDLRTDRSGRMVVEYHLVGHPWKNLAGLLWVDARGRLECGGGVRAPSGAGRTRASAPTPEPGPPADGTIHVGVWAWVMLAQRVGSAFGTLGGAWANVATVGAAILAAQLILREADAEREAVGQPVPASGADAVLPAEGWAASGDGPAGVRPSGAPEEPVPGGPRPNGFPLEHPEASVTLGGSWDLSGQQVLVPRVGRGTRRLAPRVMDCTA
jgi:hypothetical protein